MAEAFVDPDIEVDSAELADLQFSYMEEGFPGWVPAAGNLDTWILECGARNGSEVGVLALNPPPELWRTFGEKIAQVLPIDPKPAVATSVWTLGDTDGHTIDAGTVVSIADVPFEVVDEVIVPTGQDTAAVSLVAVDDGPEGNDLVEPVELEEFVGYTVTIVLDAPTGQGADGETEDEYQDRLAREQELNAPRPLNVRDVELFGKRTLGVERVVVLDNYRPAGQPNPGDPEDANRALTFTVCGIDEVGQPLSAGVRAVLLASLQAARGTNWSIYSIDPAYTVVDVHFEAVCHRDADPAGVREQALAAITEYLSPTNWGQPLQGDERKWVNTPEVRHRELAGVLDRVVGLDYVTVLEFGIQGTPLTENVDVSLGAGPVRLATPGDITGEVTAP